MIPANGQPDVRADVAGLSLLIVFAVASLVVTAAVWALGVFSGWWLLVPAVLVYLLSAGGVMWAVFHTLSGPEDAGDSRPAPPTPPEPRPSAAPLGHFGKPLPH